MAEAYYEPTPATDGATMNPVPGAVFQVFEIADTTFATPLSLRVGSGNPITSVTASDTLATLPGVYVTSPNFEHIWKSGTFEWRRDSIDGAKKAIEDAKIAAADSAAAAETSADSAAVSASLVNAPADTVMRDVAANPATAFATQLSATIASKTGVTTDDPAHTTKLIPGAGKNGLFIRNEQPKYAAKIDQYGTNGVHDAFNIACLFGGAHTPLSVNSLNETLSTCKFVNSGAQTGGAVVAAVGDNINRTAALFGADNSGTGPSYLSSMKGKSGIAFRASYDPGEYTNAVIWATPHNVAGNLVAIENDAAHTAGSVLRLQESNAASTVPIIVVLNSGAGDSIQAPNFTVTKDARVKVKQVESNTSFNDAQLLLQSAGMVATRNVADANPVLKVRNLNATSSGDILQLANSAGDNRVRFNNNGAVILKAAAPVADTALANNEMSFSYDGASTITFKVKDSAGVVKTTTLAAT